MKVGDRVPSFELPDQDGKAFKLDDELGKGPLVFFFYPRDETPVCTAEACSFRDANDDFVQAGANVFGISSDSVSSHKRFADKHRLTYRLLADVGGAVREQLDVPRAFFGLKDGRVTYVVDKGGVVRMVHEAALSAQAHVDEALAIIKSLKS
ncbi:MAG: peroxiredoxin [Deltaproteobacteria bacterium]|nr:peroxiredoxin [Deltaproteobacteria bacterium]